MADEGTFWQSEDGRVTIDTRPDFEVLVRTDGTEGGLVDLRTRENPVVASESDASERPWLTNETWLSVDDARDLALQLQEAARVIEEDEALGPDA